MQLFDSQIFNRLNAVMHYLWIIMKLSSSVWSLILTAPIHCKGSTSDQVMQCCNSTNLLRWRNKLIHILDGLRASTFSFSGELFETNSFLNDYYTI